jgi:ABC-2 type transport system ATP-binding protein
VTATVPQGATGLLGANGAGKSTLIRAILGLVNVGNGRIEVFGLDVARVPRQVRARIGYVSELDACLPGPDAVSSVAYGGELCGLSPEDALQRAHDVLSFVALGEARYRELGTFSTGMKQRLKLAQALVHDPDLLLLDEPTNGMDPLGRDQMLRLLDDLAHREHVSLLFSSHVLHDVEEICSALVVLDHGRVAAAGPVAEWQSPTGHVYEVRIKGDEPAFVEALRAAGIDGAVADDGMLRVVARDGNVQRMFAVASRLGAQIRHLRRHLPTVEDFYARVTDDPR